MENYYQYNLRKDINLIFSYIHPWTCDVKKTRNDIYRILDSSNNAYTKRRLLCMYALFVFGDSRDWQKSTITIINRRFKTDKGITKEDDSAISTAAAYRYIRRLVDLGAIKPEKAYIHPNKTVDYSSN